MLDFIIKNSGLKERIYLNKTELDYIEGCLSVNTHIERYLFTRKFVKGNVLDCSCGCGYGTFILQKNEDVNKIYGVDNDYKAIDWALQHFNTDKITYICSDINNLKINDTIDQMVSIETIEHLEHPEKLIEMAHNHNIKELYITFPSRKTTHYNKYHKYDFTIENFTNMIKDCYYIDMQFEYQGDRYFVVCKKL